MKFTNSCPKSRRERQKRSHQQNPAASTSDPKPQVNKLVMGQVKILKRGQQLNETAPDPQSETRESQLESSENELAPDSQSDNDLSSTLSLPGGLYAGPSMIVVSPSPSSVPLPAFLTKEIVDATTDLRKILHLDFP